MKRLPLVFALLLAVALVLPSVAMATDPIYLTPWDVSGPIPAGVPLCVPGGWLTMTRGQAMAAPTFLRWYFTVWDESGAVVAECKTSDSGKYWLPVQLMTAEETGSLPFNSHMGAKQYARLWAYMIPEGLAAGDYHMVGGVVQTRDAFDLFWYYDGQHSPMRIDGGDFEVINWDFTVQ